MPRPGGRHGCDRPAGGRSRNPEAPESNCPGSPAKDGIVAGPVLSGRNEASRPAHQRYLTLADRAFVLEAEAEAAAALVELELRRNEFAAVQAMSRLLGADAAA
jgi:hypothetical protein